MAVRLTVSKHSSPFPPLPTTLTVYWTLPDITGLKQE